jgi:hypothetical protein
MWVFKHLHHLISSSQNRRYSEDPLPPALHYATYGKWQEILQSVTVWLRADGMMPGCVPQLFAMATLGKKRVIKAEDAGHSGPMSKSDNAENALFTHVPKG